MTDKRKTILWILEDSERQLAANGNENTTKKLIDKIVAEGNSQMLVMRQKSIEEEFGVFNAVTSISQIDGGDLSQRIEHALPEMTDFETHHFSPKSRTNFNQMFHRPFNTCLVTKN